MTRSWTHMCSGVLQVTQDRTERNQLGHLEWQIQQSSASHKRSCGTSISISKYFVNSIAPAIVRSYALESDIRIDRSRSPSGAKREQTSGTDPLFAQVAANIIYTFGLNPRAKPILGLSSSPFNFWAAFGTNRTSMLIDSRVHGSVCYHAIQGPVDTNNERKTNEENMKCVRQDSRSNTSMPVIREA